MLKLDGNQIHLTCYALSLINLTKLQGFMLAPRKSTSDYVTEHTYLNGGEAERSTQSFVTKPFSMDDAISALA